MSAASPEYFLAVFSDKNDQFVAGLHQSSKHFLLDGVGVFEWENFECHLGRDSSASVLLRPNFATRMK